MSSQLVDQLRDALGASAVLTDADEMAPFVTDWTGMFAGAALAGGLAGLLLGRRSGGRGSSARTPSNGAARGRSTPE